jgi:hypothetical protein
MADAFDQFEMLLRENISAGVVDLTLEDDDPWWNLMQQATPEAVGGRNQDSTVVPGYQCEWKVRVQRGGLVGGGKFTGNTPTTMGAGDHMFIGQAADAKYLDPVNTPQRSYLTVKMNLRRFRGSVTANKQQLIADLAANAVEDVATGHVEDAVYQIRNMCVANGWSDGSGLVAQANGAASVVETAGGTAVPVDVGTYLRFVKGQRYIAGSNVAFGSYGSSARTFRTGASSGGAVGVMRCVNIDVDAQQMYMEAEPGMGTITVSDNDALIQADLVDTSVSSNVTAQSLAPEGFFSLVRASGNFPGTSLAVTSYSELKGFVTDHESAPVLPTPELVAKQIDKITEANIRPPSVLVSEPSVKTLYSQLERQGYATYVVPQGGQFSAAGGVGGAMVGHGNWGASAWLVSSKVRKNTICGMTPGSFKRFIPLGDKTIRWVYSGGGASGAAGMFHIVTEGRQTTELLDAPFDFFYQTGLENPRQQFSILGVKSQYDV